MLLLTLIICCQVEDNTLPPSQLKEPKLVRAVKFGALEGFIFKPNSFTNATIYIAKAPLFEAVDCFTNTISSNQLAFLTELDQLELAKQYIQNIIVSGTINRMDLKCL
jgi:hypothetical protein